MAADVVFNGERRHDNVAVVIEDTQIAALTPRADLPSSIAVYNAPRGAWLAPGFIDIQVNGGGDVLFNADPTPAALAKIAEAHRKFGVTALLPTLITDCDEAMAAALDAVSVIMAHEPGVLRIHLEGPFLSPEKPGVHRREFIRRPQAHHRQMLGSFHNGVLLVTLAPEEAPNGFIAELVASGAKVSLGHSMATYEETRAAMAEGLTGFTHLFNAMRPLSAREPGPVAAALKSPHAYYGLIVDGEHHRRAGFGDARRRAPHARERRHAARWRHEGGVRSPGQADHSPRRQLPHAGGRARGIVDRDGGRGSQLCPAFGASLGAGPALRLIPPRRFSRSRTIARPPRAGISSRHGGVRPEGHFGLRRLGSRGKIGLSPRRLGRARPGYSRFHAG